MRYRRLAVTSAVMFVAAAVLEMTLHEGAHFVAGWARGLGPTLHHNYVDYAVEDGGGRHIIAAAAGPAFSLVIGALAHLRLRAGVRDAFARMFWWQLAIAGYVGCCGYMMIAPIFAGGDTGFVLRALGAPMWAIVVVAVVGFAALWKLIAVLAPYLVSMMGVETAASPQTRAPFVAAAVPLALALGIPVLVLLNLPVPTFLSLIAPIMSPMAVFYAYGAYLNATPSADGDWEERVAGPMPVAWIIILAILVAVNRLLVAGIPR